MNTEPPNTILTSASERHRLHPHRPPAARHWVRRRDHGRLINMVSRAGIDGVPGVLAYSTAKAGIIWLTRSVGVLWWPTT